MKDENPLRSNPTVRVRVISRPMFAQGADVDVFVCILLAREYFL